MTELQICKHYQRRWLDYIENKDTGEVLEGNFEVCIDCDEVLLD